MAPTGDMFASPWDWLPEDLRARAAAPVSPFDPLAAEVAPAPVQPGLGIPAGIVDQAAAPGGEIAMPPDDFAGVTPEQLAAARQAQATEAGPSTAAEWPAINQALAAGEPWMGPPVNPDAAQPMPVDPNGWDPALTAAPMPEPVPAAEPAPALGSLGGVPLSLVPDDLRPMSERPGSELEQPTVPWEDDGYAFANQSEEAKTAELFDYTQRRNETERAALAKAALADEQRAEANYQAWKTNNERSYADARALEAEAKALADERIDPDRWWNDRSTGQTILGILAATAGGLVQHLNGGRNIGADMIERAIERDIAAQRDNLANRRALLGERRGLLGDRMAMNADTLRQQETFRVASYDRAIEQVKTDMMGFDPRGTQRIAYGQVLEGLQQKKAAAIDAYRKAQQQQLMDAYKLENERLDAVKKLADIEKIRAEAAAKARAGTGGNKVKPEDVKLTPEEYAARGLVAPPVAMSAKEYDAWQKQKKGSQEIEKNANATGLSDQELTRLVELPDGQSFVARGTPESVEKLRDKVAATETVVRLMDEALRLRSGWTSDAKQSEEWQALQANWAAAKGVAKDVLGLGALSGPDMDLVEKFIGAKDPTSVRSPEAGIRKARQNILNMTTDSLRSRGLKGRFDIKAPTYEKPSETYEDGVLQRAQSEGVGEVFGFRADADADRTRGKVSDAEVLADYDRGTGIPLGIERQIDKWESEARSGNEATQQKARAYLVKLSETGGNAQIRARAANAITAANMAEPAETGPATATARDSIAQPPPKRGKR